MSMYGLLHTKFAQYLLCNREYERDLPPTAKFVDLKIQFK